MRLTTLLVAIIILLMSCAQSDQAGQAINILGASDHEIAAAAREGRLPDLIAARDRVQSQTSSLQGQTNAEQAKIDLPVQLQAQLNALQGHVNALNAQKRSCRGTKAQRNQCINGLKS